MGKSAIISVCIILLIFQSSYAQQCLNNPTLTHVKIPKKLLSLSEFDNIIVNVPYTQVYFAPLRPWSFANWFDFVVTVTKISGNNYFQHATATENGLPITPSFAFSVLPANGNPNWETIFVVDDGFDTVYPIWSSMPERYYWTMRCRAEITGGKCPVGGVDFGLFMTGCLDDFPWASVIEDLCEGTGVRFRADQFHWFFVFPGNCTM